MARYFAQEQEAIRNLEAELKTAAVRMTELEEEHGGEEGFFSALEKVNNANVSARLKEIEGDIEAKDEVDVLDEWLKLTSKEADLKKELKDAEADLDAKAYKKYPTLAEPEIKTLVVDDKWIATLDAIIHGEMDRISLALADATNLGVKCFEKREHFLKHLFGRDHLLKYSRVYFHLILLAHYFQHARAVW